MDNTNNFSEPNVQGVNNMAEDVLSKREKTVTWIFSLLSPVITGGVMYFMWRKSHPQKAKQANKISWICFFIQAVIYGAFEATAYFLQKRLIGKIQNQTLITNEIVQNQAQSQVLIESEKNQDSSQHQTNVAMDWKTYQNEKYKYELKYPTDWNIEVLNDKTTDFIYHWQPNEFCYIDVKVMSEDDIVARARLSETNRVLSEKESKESVEIDNSLSTIYFLSSTVSKTGESWIVRNKLFFNFKVQYFAGGSKIAENKDYESHSQTCLSLFSQTLSTFKILQ